MNCTNKNDACVGFIEDHIVETKFGEIQVSTGDAIVQFCGHAHQSCIICYDNWDDELKNDVCVVLRCGHPMCFKCLRNLFDASLSTHDTDTGERHYTNFACPTCRKVIIVQEMERVKDQVFRASYEDGLKGLASYIPLPALDRREIVKNLLAKFGYDRDKVWNELYEMVALFQKEEFDKLEAVKVSRLEEQERLDSQRRENKELQRGIDASLRTLYIDDRKSVLTFQEKMKIYNEANAPVKRLMDRLIASKNTTDIARLKTEIRKSK